MRQLALALLFSAALPAIAPAYDEADLDNFLDRSICANCNLAGVDLQDGELDGSVLIDTNLRGANLSKSNLDGADFSGSDLRGAKLKGANLANASFINANLDGADLSGANLQDAEFLHASLEGTNFANSSIAMAQGADLAKAFNVPAPQAVPVAPKMANPNLDVGSVFLVSFAYCPDGTHEADGSAIQVNENQILYSLYGNSYGGDTKTFHLPDLRQQVPLAGMHYCVVTAGRYPERP